MEVVKLDVTLLYLSWVLSAKYGQADSETPDYKSCHQCAELFFLLFCSLTADILILLLTSFSILLA